MKPDVMQHPSGTDDAIEPLALAVGRSIAGSRCGALPQEAIRRAKTAVLDYVAVTLAGGGETAVALLARAIAAGEGPSTVFGRTARAPALDAALVNGTASHALDYDDLSATMKGHPSGPVLAAALALAEEIGASGKALLLAYVLGVEAEARLGRALNPQHQNRGWHPTGTIGVFGATAACAKLFELTAGQTADALAISASLASGLKANFGTMVKSLHSGHAARSGLMAATLAREGFTANAQVFEHRAGFFAAYGAPAEAARACALERWGDPLEIVDPGLGIKLYPCCASIHAALDGVLGLREAHGLTPGDIDGVDVWMHANRLDHTDRPDPATELDAKFSVQYCVARALTDGELLVRHFRDGAHRDAGIAGLVGRVHTYTCEPGSWLEQHPYGAVARVRLRRGGALEARVAQAHGRPAGPPVPEEKLVRKFEDCCEGVLAREPAAELRARIERIDALHDVRELTRLAREGLLG